MNKISYCCKELISAIEDSVINQESGDKPNYFLSEPGQEDVRHYIMYCPFCGDKKYRRIICGFCREKGIIYEFTSMTKAGEHVVIEHPDRIEDEE